MALNDLNHVRTTVIVGGKEVNFSCLVLCQEFNKHHTFTIRLPHESLEKRWFEKPGQVFPLVGSDVSITFLHLIEGSRNTFRGIVREVSYTGKHGVHNHIVISGGSPTLLLDGNRTMDSFTDKSLRDITEEAIKNSGNGAEVIIKPMFKGKIDYLCQYGESCFEFMNRLSWMYGEWFYYDGQQILFGKPDSQETIELVYDIHITQMEVAARAVPSNPGMYDYHRHDDEVPFYAATNEDTNTSGYTKMILNRSSALYSAQSILPLPVPVSSPDQLKELVKREKARTVSNMLVLKGRTNTCKAGIGKIVKLSLPRSLEVPMTNVDNFLVGKIVHYADGEKRYHNVISAYAADAGCVPMQPVLSPLTGPQLAIVTDNEDSKGRVKVQLQWQKKNNKTTNWLRVQTPDAGSSDKGVRGSVFIPEIGDQVMIGFEYSDPNRPYVMGSLFPETISTGGGEGNKEKSIVSRSGISVLLDDETGSIIIKDKNDTDSMVSLDGEGNIAITCKESITLNCGKSTLTMNKGGEIGISGTTLFIGGSTSVDMAAGAGVDGNGGDVSGLHAQGGEISVFTKGDANIGAENNVNVFGQNDVTVAAMKILTTKGQDKITIN